MNTEQDFAGIRWDGGLTWAQQQALSRIEAVQKLATEQVEWLQRTKRKVVRQRDAFDEELGRVSTEYGELHAERYALKVVLNEAVMALDAATVIGEREGCRLNYGNHDRIVRNARQVLKELEAP